MADECRSAVLRGFNTAVTDIGDQLHPCHPLLSFEGDPTLYVARRLDWQNDPKALAATDPSEASDLGTLLPDAHAQAIVSGEAVIAVGTGFVQAAEAAGIQLDDSGMTFTRVRNAECRISVATPASFAKLKTRLADEARTAFDEELGGAAHCNLLLSERGNAALLLLRRCGPRRRDDLAIRQLAGTLQNRELDLYRRLLIRFSLELGEQENDLDQRAIRHVRSVLSWYTTQGQPPPKKYIWKSSLDPKFPTDMSNSTVFNVRVPEQHPTRHSRNQTPIREKYPRFVEDLMDKGLLASGGILSKGSMPLATGHSRSSDFGDGVQQDSDNYYSKLPPFPTNLLVRSMHSESIPGRTRTKVVSDHFYGNVTRIQPMEGKQAGNGNLHIMILPVSGKDVVDTMDYREAV